MPLSGLPSTFPVSTPAVIENFSLSGQTSAIATTTLLSPALVGLYLVTVVLEVTTVGTAGTISANVTFTDDVGNPTIAVVTSATVTSTSRTQATYAFINTSQANPIQYSTTFNSVTGTPAYRVYYSLALVG